MSSSIPELRPYQTCALAAVRAEFEKGSRAVVAVSPTGSGKTVLIAEITRRSVARGGRVLVVVHRRELARQTVRHLKRHGLEAIRVILGGNAVGPAQAPVVVAAIQTLTGKRWRDRLPPSSLVLWDECHHIKAPSFMTVRDAYADAHHIGFTATPERADRSPLGDVFDAMVVVARTRQLIEDGFLVPCDVWAPAGGRKALAADPVDAYLTHGQSKRAIVFCSSVVHARDVAERLAEAGVASEQVDGAMPTRDRDVALSRFASGATQVITNCNLITEGFDVPAAKCIVLARGCDSVAMYLQAVGRALRPEPGEARALLLDLRGAVHRHGLPDAEREFSLHGEPIRRVDALDPITQCRACGAVYRAGSPCPMCGAIAAPPKLPVVRPEELLQIAHDHSPEQRRAHYEQLCALAAARGYKPGWAYYRFVGRYGHPPQEVA